MSSNFNMSINAREDGSLDAAYIQVSAAKVARTEEKIPSVFLVDYDSNDQLVGIEILAPVSMSVVREAAKNLQAAQRKSLDDFVDRYAPASIIVHSE